MKPGTKDNPTPAPAGALAGAGINAIAVGVHVVEMVCHNQEQLYYFFILHHEGRVSSQAP